MCKSQHSLRYSHLDVAGASGMDDPSYPSTAASVVAVVLNALDD